MYICVCIYHSAIWHAMIWRVRCYNTLSYVSHMNNHLTKKWTLPADGLCRRVSTFCSKTHFSENQKSWPKTWWELVTWVWFRISQNIYNVRARWVAKRAARFHHSKFETNPPRLRYHFIALFGLMVTSHMWIRHVSHINGHMHEPCLTYKWVLNHIWLSHVSHVNETDAIQLYDAALLLLQDALFCPLLVAKVCLYECTNSGIYVCICMCIYIKYLH